jgi:hypothetical protein
MEEWSIVDCKDGSTVLISTEDIRDHDEEARFFFFFCCRYVLQRRGLHLRLVASIAIGLSQVSLELLSKQTKCIIGNSTYFFFPAPW